ncbi:MAG: hypothetical protein ACUVRL_02865 [Candidatus Saccharicenans sp.]|uniref:hypothetical protein n=1 Tax=Candidatus Saccharicenans sp. TaxID=2819258 RepID=UPI00404AC8F6
MRKRVNLLVMVCFLGFLLMVNSAGWSQIKEVTAPIVTQKLADLGVLEIYGHGCACDLPGIDALYFDKVQVEVSAAIKFTVEDSAVIGVLKVSYFDLMKGRTESREVMLQAYLFRGCTSNLVDVVGGPILVKKSVGITAEVKVAGAATGDPNLANNSTKVDTCKVRLL